MLLYDKKKGLINLLTATFRV